MDAGAFDAAVNDGALAIFLRYFGAGSTLALDTPGLEKRRDREMLLFHWALSPKIQKLTAYVLEHRHEITTVLESLVRIEDGMVRGRLDALATVRQRRLSGLRTAVVSREPVRSYHSGPNQVLGWVLKQAGGLVARMTSFVPDSAGYEALLAGAARNFDHCRRTQGIGNIIADVDLGKRPTPSALLESGRSRRQVYRLAYEAYQELVSIEAGDAEATVALLRETLLAPLEPWRRFELYVGLSLIETLAHATGVPMALNLLVGKDKWLIGRASDFAVFWQSRTHLYKSPDPEPSEIVVNDILAAYGAGQSSDRPDLVVVDTERDAVVSIVEVKYLSSEDASDRVRAAVGQVVRYSRGYSALAAASSLLGNSIVVVSQGLGLRGPHSGDPSGIPMLTDFEQMRSGSLVEWSDRLATRPSA